MQLDGLLDVASVRGQEAEAGIGEGDALHRPDRLVGGQRLTVEPLGLVEAAAAWPAATAMPLSACAAGPGKPNSRARDRAVACQVAASSKSALRAPPGCPSRVAKIEALAPGPVLIVPS